MIELVLVRAELTATASSPVSLLRYSYSPAWGINLCIDSIRDLSTSVVFLVYS